MTSQDLQRGATPEVIRSEEPVSRHLATTISAEPPRPMPSFASDERHHSLFDQRCGNLQTFFPALLVPHCNLPLSTTPTSQRPDPRDPSNISVDDTAGSLVESPVVLSMGTRRLDINQRWRFKQIALAVLNSVAIQVLSILCVLLTLFLADSVLATTSSNEFQGVCSEAALVLLNWS